MSISLTEFMELNQLSPLINVFEVRLNWKMITNGESLLNILLNCRR